MMTRAQYDISLVRKSTSPALSRRAAASRVLKSTSAIGEPVINRSLKNASTTNGHAEYRIKVTKPIAVEGKAIALESKKG
jgi:hypothetical protein